ncbi:MAG: RimK family alpha-L-glutamate ligase, partial [Halobaculum sp.]
MRESRPSETDEVRVGVVSFHNSKETKAICNAITALGHEPVWIARSNLRSSITDETVVVEPQVDAAINRLLVTKSRNPLCELSLAGVVADRVPTLNPPDAVAGMLHKHRAAAELARAGVPVPDTLLAPDREPPADWPTRVGEPAVRKPGIGTNGTDVARVEAGDAA